MLLAKNEKLIKNWDYARSKQGNVKTSASLTLTSKRIIYSSKSKNETIRDEIPLDSVKGVSFNKNFQSNFSAILMIAFGIFTCITLIGIPVGIFLIVIGLKLKDQGSFIMQINTKGQEGTPMCFGASHIYKIKNNKAKLKVTLDREEIDDIIETFGAIVIDSQEQSN